MLRVIHTFQNYLWVVWKMDQSEEGLGKYYMDKMILALMEDYYI